MLPIGLQCASIKMDHHVDGALQIYDPRRNSHPWRIFQTQKVGSVSQFLLVWDQRFGQASRQNFNLKTLENQLFFQGKVEAYQKHTGSYVVLVGWKTPKQTLPYRGDLCLQNSRLPIGLRCASINPSRAQAPLKWRIWDTAKDRFLSFSSTVSTKCMCEQLPLFTEMKYLASRQNWNLQTWKTNSWVVPSTHRNRDLRCTIHRNKPPMHKQWKLKVLFSS